MPSASRSNAAVTGAVGSALAFAAAFWPKPVAVTTNSTVNVSKQYVFRMIFLLQVGCLNSMPVTIAVQTYDSGCTIWLSRCRRATPIRKWQAYSDLDRLKFYRGIAANRCRGMTFAMRSAQVNPETEFRRLTSPKT